MIRSSLASVLWRACEGILVPWALGTVAVTSWYGFSTVIEQKRCGFTTTIVRLM